jgi:uncharacterized protein (DUF1697 family)
VHFFQKNMNADSIERIKARVTIEEAFVLGDELIVDFAERMSGSKLTLEFFERCAGSIGTARNWNTLLKVLRVADEIALSNSQKT